MKILGSVAVLLLAAAPVLAHDQGQSKEVSLHGSIQTDILFPQVDEKLGTGTSN